MHLTSLQTDKASKSKPHYENYGRSEHARKDPARKRSMVFMSVRNRCTDILLLPNGQLIGPGTHKIEVYDDQVSAVQALVEKDASKIDAARKVFFLSLAAEMMDKHLTKDECPVESAEELVELLLAAESDKTRLDDVVADALKKAFGSTPHSVESEFRRMNKRDILPLDSAELITGSEHAEPQREHVDEEVRKAAEANAQALALALGPAVAEAMKLAIPAIVAGIRDSSRGGGQR